MVLIAAAVFSKNGKALVARQFVTDMSRARLEGLLDAFPKLIQSEKDASLRQHTFVETDSVRYVFHPMENIYMVLITTKASNILEDLETLRLFSRVIPEYCRTNDEKEILAHDFDLIFAFDEIVTLGYRENVNLAQIRTFTEMDSHEERVFMQIKQAQEKAAMEAAKERAKELKRQQKEALSRGVSARPGATGFGSSSGISSSSVPTPSVVSEKPAPRPAAAASRAGGGKALKLGAKTKNEEQFIEELAQQGQAVTPVAQQGQRGAQAPTSTFTTSNVKREPVHIRVDEKIIAVVGRDGGLQQAEVSGSFALSVATADYNTVAIQLQNNAPAGAQLQTHPHLDKKEWQTSSLLKLKSATKPFPVNAEVGVLKWRLPLQEEEQLPLALNVWPQESSDGCQVNIEYTLQREDLQLDNVVITVPLPAATAPVVSECEGSYEYQKSRSQLVWTLPVIDENSSTGTLEFTVPNGHSDSFFPVHVAFSSQKLYCNLSVDGAQLMDGSAPVVYSIETNFGAEKYEIV
ncbi:unnamed protein product, partial [Mesorhabditis belari]|uniref:Coatomer subunit delta n=1 Tax=Mesorhabditis belari TaxID=2138241 RepID=A0AAF3EVL1_9BILA